MAVLHLYSQSADKSGYYLNGWTPETGHTTIQTRRVCDSLFDWLGFSVGDQIPHDLLNGLLEVGLLYTGDPTTADENIPDEFEFEKDVKSVLTNKQYNRLIGFAKSYEDQTPARIIDLINQLDAEAAVVDDSYIPDRPGGDWYLEERDNEVDHGQFERIIDRVYRDDESVIVDPLPDLSDEHRAADAAISYHYNYQEITEARRDGDSLEYATRAVVDNGEEAVAGPVCGFRVDLGGIDTVVVEVIVDPDALTKLLSYGDEGIRHRIVVAENTVEWETALPQDSNFRYSNRRIDLLEHQIECLEIIKNTIECHPEIYKGEMVKQIISGGYLERGIKMTSQTWKGSSLLGELLDATNNREAVGVVDFFNNDGGYGFIETDAHEEDVFYHMEDVGGPDIQEGQRLRFDIVETEKGPRATDVERIE